MKPIGRIMQKPAKVRDKAPPGKKASREVAKSAPKLITALIVNRIRNVFVKLNFIRGFR